MRFWARNLGCIIAKNDDLARSRAFLRPLILASSSAFCCSRFFIVRCSSCIFALFSGCFSRTLQQLMLVQGSFLQVVFVCPATWQTVHIRARILDSDKNCLSYCFKLFSSSLAVDSCTCKTVRFSFSFSSFISNGLFSLATVEHGIVICAVEAATGAKAL